MVQNLCIHTGRKNRRKFTYPWRILPEKNIPSSIHSNWNDDNATNSRSSQIWFVQRWETGLC